MPSIASIQCVHCGNENRGEIERYGDGEGAIALDTKTCAHEGCGKELCPECRSGECYGCKHVLCGDHFVLFDKLPYCQTCTAAMESDLDCSCIAIEPKCTCIRLDVDIDDATDCDLHGGVDLDALASRGCDLHDPYSEWREAMAHFDRQTAVEEWTHEPAVDEPCPFDDEPAILIPAVIEMDLSARLRASLKQVGAA